MSNANKNTGSEKYPVATLKAKTSSGRLVKVRVQEGRTVLEINSESFPRSFSPFAIASEDAGRKIIKDGIESHIHELKRQFKSHPDPSTLIQ